MQRHGISRLPDVDGDKPAKKKFKRYPIGYVHIDIAKVRSEEGKLYLFVAPKAVGAAGQPERAARPSSSPPGWSKKPARWPPLRDLIAALRRENAPPERFLVHLSVQAAHRADRGIQFTNRSRDRYAFTHIFDRVCQENDPRNLMGAQAHQG